MTHIDTIPCGSLILYTNVIMKKGSDVQIPDPWRPDPKFSASEQSIIYPSDWSNWPWSMNGNEPTDLYYYWRPYNNKNFTKGHLLRSADRGGAGSEMNIQTFYPTNIAPEAYLYGDHWSKVEELLSDTWECSRYDIRRCRMLLCK